MVYGRAKKIVRRARSVGVCLEKVSDPIKVARMASATTRNFIVGFLGGIVLSALLAGAFMAGRVSQVAPVQRPAFEQAPSDSAQAAATEIAAEEAPPAGQPLTPEAVFAKEFETFLNRFLKELAKETTQYKKDRRILKEAIDPYNLAGTDNAELSYRGFRDEIAPMLRKKGAYVLDIFGRSERVVEGLLADKSETVKEKLLAEWKALEKEHMHALLDYFEKEDQLIQAHEELLKFYFIHSKLYKVDMDAGKIVFSNEKYQAREQALLEKIETLRQAASPKNPKKKP